MCSYTARYRVTPERSEARLLEAGISGLHASDPCHRTRIAIASCLCRAHTAHNSAAAELVFLDRLGNLSDVSAGGQVQKTLSVSSLNASCGFACVNAASSLLSRTKVLRLPSLQCRRKHNLQSLETCFRILTGEAFTEATWNRTPKVAKASSMSERVCLMYASGINRTMSRRGLRRRAQGSSTRLNLPRSQCRAAAVFAAARNGAAPCVACRARRGQQSMPRVVWRSRQAGKHNRPGALGIGQRCKPGATMFKYQTTGIRM